MFLHGYLLACEISMVRTQTLIHLIGFLQSTERVSVAAVWYADDPEGGVYA